MNRPVVLLAGALLKEPWGSRPYPEIRYLRIEKRAS